MACRANYKEKYLISEGGMSAFISFTDYFLFLIWSSLGRVSDTPLYLVLLTHILMLWGIKIRCDRLLQSKGVIYLHVDKKKFR